MEDPKNKSPRLASMIRWAARILGILAIAFISLFALDTFAEGAGLGQKIVAFLLHMIASFVLIIVLIMAWKHRACRRHFDDAHRAGGICVRLQPQLR